MSRFDDPAVVANQYATEANLRARQALWADVEGEDGTRVLWRVLQSLAPVGRVLEVGGGQGELAERMQRELDAEVAFIDQSRRMVELARARGVHDAQVGDVQRLPFPDESFDVAVAAWMLYHVADLERALSELARVLRPTGKLVAVTNSVRHLEEFRALIGQPSSTLEGLFNAETGAATLGRHFAAVERHDAEVVAVVRDRETLVGYQQSMSSAFGPVPEDVPLPFRVHGRNAIFVATK
ncbi:MAG TPA: class I SAM-dependent methyltransferase [Gaiellaceae bacterium]|nr:class I SAM-dependent methyltransferase [Gaiellaceae bacterium]